MIQLSSWLCNTDETGPVEITNVVVPSRMLAVFKSSKLLAFKILGMQPVTCGGYWSTVPKVPPSRTV